ncbi:helix-turn-helix transcriptional regulator [Leptothrix discophora]|uniref:LuxR C-terminal-related transcriptional regulator n=1 Tax=Leptothrix discophora TaxID=89 RepID=A0ABT9G4E8_LEPDI|nr:LuxR C-terminal-related transcriptional regulator [Leptothrix discophora]MDP4301068.1 LuxR C-terminal-related transcriptional regulator [Leptothrix discophora]
MLIETPAPCPTLPSSARPELASLAPALDLLLGAGAEAGPVLHQLLGQALDELDYGLAIVNRQGRLMLANHRARTLFERSNGVCQLQIDRVVARHPLREEPLARAIQAAAQQGRRGLVAVGDEDRPQSVAVVPLGGQPVQGVLLVFGKAQMCEALSVDHYARVHGLTHAEGMVLAALCDGDTPTEVAQRFGVAVSTVRSQIAAIRQKTQCGSIRELVRRVAVLPPIVSALGRGPLHAGPH